jgi:hypothetical protein
MSEGVPVAAVEAMDAANCSSATRRPYRGAWRCRPASPAERKTDFLVNGLKYPNLHLADNQRLAKVRYLMMEIQLCHIYFRYILTCSPSGTRKYGIISVRQFSLLTSEPNGRFSLKQI